MKIKWEILGGPSRTSFCFVFVLLIKMDKYNQLGSLFFLFSFFLSKLPREEATWSLGQKPEHQERQRRQMERIFICDNITELVQ